MPSPAPQTLSSAPSTHPPAPHPLPPAQTPTPLARPHPRSRRWPVRGQIAWWLLLLPVALAAFSATRTTRKARATGYAAAGVLLLFGFIHSGGQPTPQASS